MDDRCRIAILHSDGRGRENYLNESSLYKKKYRNTAQRKWSFRNEAAS